MQMKDEVQFNGGHSFQTQKRKTLVGPWKNVAEFHKVHDWLYADSATMESRHLALRQMRIWSLRRSTLCPAAVLATSVVLEVHLKDIQHAISSPSDLQTLYASAFTRFFNYMSSIMQTHNMRTMYQTAQVLGLESFVVDLRHICAHGQVFPPLEILRSTALYCLKWLQRYYWDSQRASMCDIDASRIRRKDKTQFDENVSQLFSIYDSALECYLKGARNLKGAKRHVHGNRFAQLKQYYEHQNLKEMRAAFDTIVKELIALVRREASMKDLAEIYIEALLKSKYFFAVAGFHSSGEDLETLIEVTQNLFRMLAVYGLIEDLFHGLLEIAENPIADKTRRAGASFWAMQIAAGFVAFRKCKQIYKAELDQNPKIKDFDFTTLNIENTSKKLLKLLIHIGVDKKRTLIFGDSFRRPWVWIFDRAFVQERLNAVNEFTAPILKSVLPLVEPELSNNEIEVFVELINTLFENNAAVENNEETSNQTEDKSKVYTVNDLLKCDSKSSSIEVNENKDTTNENAQFGIWTIVPDDETHNWSTCSLGRLPWE